MNMCEKEFAACGVCENTKRAIKSLYVQGFYPHGRSARWELGYAGLGVFVIYVLFMLAVVIGGILLGRFFAMLLTILMMLFVIGTVIPIWCLHIRRLHDVNLTGWVSLLLFVPGLNMLLSIALMLIKGTDGANKYGSESDLSWCASKKAENEETDTETKGPETKVPETKDPETKDTEDTEKD